MKTLFKEESNTKNSSMSDIVIVAVLIGLIIVVVVVVVVVVVIVVVYIQKSLLAVKDELKARINDVKTLFEDEGKTKNALTSDLSRPMRIFWSY